MKKWLLALLCMWLLQTGCQETAVRYDPAAISAARKQFLLETEPAGVEGILDVQETYQSPRDVTLVGKIGGVTNPWTPGKAAFILADPSTLSEIDAQGAQHVCDDSGCKFCAKQKINRLKEGLAAVEFRTAEGKILSIDARQLFSVSENQLVVVRGRAEVNNLGCLVVAANGLYVRK